MVVHNGAVIGGGTILNDCNVTGVLSRHVLKETIFGRNLKKDITLQKGRPQISSFLGLLH